MSEYDDDDQAVTEREAAAVAQSLEPRGLLARAWTAWDRASGKPRPERRQRRNAYPIHGYVGPNGSGKSALMVYDTLPTLEAGLPVLSTVRLLDYEDPRPCEGCDPEHLALYPALRRSHERGHRQAHPLWTPFVRWDQLLSWSFGDVLMDEVAGVASSRKSNQLPWAVEVGLQQLRRGDNVVRFSAPNWARAEVIIRECAQAATYCLSSNGVERVEADGRKRRYATKRLVEAVTYDAVEFTDFTEGKKESATVLVRDRLWLPDSGVFDAYDTFDAVSAIGVVDQGGRCLTCGGSRRTPTCKCSGDDAPLWSGPQHAPHAGPRVRGAGGAGSGLVHPDGLHDHSHDETGRGSRVLADSRRRVV